RGGDEPSRRLAEADAEVGRALQGGGSGGMPTAVAGASGRRFELVRNLAIGPEGRGRPMPRTLICFGDVDEGVGKGEVRRPPVGEACALVDGGADERMAELDARARDRDERGLLDVSERAGVDSELLAGFE